MDVAMILGLLLGSAGNSAVAAGKNVKLVVKAANTLPHDYPFEPVPFTDVKITDEFWSPRLDTNRLTTIWYDLKRCEDTGRIDNFAKAAKLMPGDFKGNTYDDSDVYKVIEGAAYTLAEQKDATLERYLDALIDKIAAAQEPDGYLYTARTVNYTNAISRAGKERWLNERGGFNGGNDSHELYNAGHLYEAAVAYYQATGKRKLLDVALKNADLIDQTWGPQPGKLKIPSGHQEIEIGLVKLYRVTSDRKYLDLAKFLLDCRGRFLTEAPRKTNNFYATFYSDDKPVTEQTEAEGHAVRSAYMYSAMADVAALNGDNAYLHAVDALWTNMVSRKMYLTGGIGALGAGEAFGANYELPNATAYNETCAAVGNALWNERMFLLHGDAQYVDVLERVLYNGFLSGVAFTGDRFFYPNPLESDGKRKFNHGSNERSSWFDTSCCPVNIVRFLPQLSGWIYARRNDDLYVNLFIGSDAKVDLNGVLVAIQQRTQYPWDGHVTLKLSPSEPREFSLYLRIPGWARNQPVPGDLYRYGDGLQPKISLMLNGTPFDFQMTNGYAVCQRVWHSGDTVVLNLEMSVRQAVANPKMKAGQNCFAIERGPLVYCAEGADNNGNVLQTVFSSQSSFEIETNPSPLSGVRAIQAESADTDTSLSCIPYYAWCNRGPNEMRVWQPTTTEKESSIISLWPEVTTNSSQPVVREIVEDAGQPGAPDRRYRNITRPELEVFRAKHANGTGVLIMPGGGYWYVVMDKEGRDIAAWFNSIGVNAFVLKYRLPNTTTHRFGSEIPLEDAQRAMRIVRSRAAEFGVRPNRIGAVGFSAGGHLASTLGTHFDLGNLDVADSVERVSCRPDFLILGYPVISMDQTITHASSRNELLGKNPSADLAHRFSNELQVTSNTPPVFIFCASDDETVIPENSLRFYTAARAVDVPAELHVFEWGGHGFGIRSGNRAGSSWPGLCESWLRERGLLENQTTEKVK